MPSDRPELFRRRWLLTLVILLLIGGLLYPLWTRSAARRLAKQTRQAQQSGDYYRALQLATQLLARRPDSVDALRAAAESSRQLGQLDEALRYYERLLAHAEAVTVADHLALGELHWEARHPDAAERHFRAALDGNPRLTAAHTKLIHLLAVQCRTREATAQRQQLLRNGVWTTEDLLFLAKPQDLMDSPELDELLEQNPEHPHLLLAKARQARIRHRNDEAAGWLDKALAARGDDPEVHAERGLLLLEQEVDEAQLAQWHQRLPPGADAHPDVWVVRGFWAQARKDTAGAARCFAEAARRAPNHRVATHQLSLALAALGQEAMAGELSVRVEQLDLLSRTIDEVYDNTAAVAAWLRAAELLEALGRIHEATAWYRTIAGQQRGNEVARAKVAQLAARVSPALPLVVPEFNPVLKLKLEDYPLALPAAAGAVAARPRGADAPRGIRFVDVAQRAGLQFSFLGADQPLRRGRRIFEVFGGGLAAVDFDLDGWPDVYCAQGAPWEAREESHAYRDRLFRNTGQGQFVDVTAAAWLDEGRFSQGVAAGDFDSDGFPDLLVANVGENRLFRNNGDGTFRDVTAAAALAGGRWTSSVALADLNGDALPDIYEVNYLSGPGLFDVICTGPQAQIGSCSPSSFPCEPDRFFLNLGDGRFAEQTQQAGFVAPDGKGLGVVAADFDGDGLLSVFVANDTTANHFYVNRAGRGGAPDFVDRARFNGLAFDRDGMTAACMGIALDDVDADGWLDLFVTNFSDESNTLYLGREGQYFEDGTRAAGLRLPSLPLLGFGTEFLDADLDGDPDLVVVNGHITDTDQDGADFQMRPQFFDNRGGRFVELAAEAVGDYFDRRLLGRSLIRLDVDRDGRQDVAVSHLDAPLALLHNETPAAGHFLALRLCGVQSDRDAVGAAVTIVTPAGVRRVGQLTAGDGYMCSNQRQLVFGLGDESSVARLVVRWPAGGVQEFADLGADCQWLIVEGRPEPLVMGP